MDTPSHALVTLAKNLSGLGDEAVSTLVPVLKKDYGMNESEAKQYASGLLKWVQEQSRKPAMKILSKAKDERVIYGPASVEMVDHEDDKITGEALSKALDTLFLFNNGTEGAISYQHLDILPGTILRSYDVGGEVFKTEVRDVTEADLKTFKLLRDNDVAVGTPALFLVAKIRTDVKYADEIWADIQKGNLGAFSISGQSVEERKSKDCSGYSCKLVNEITKIDLSATTICETPMNPGSGFVVLSKSKDGAEEVVFKAKDGKQYDLTVENGVVKATLIEKDCCDSCLDGGDCDDGVMEEVVEEIIEEPIEEVVETLPGMGGVEEVEEVVADEPLEVMLEVSGMDELEALLEFVVDGFMKADLKKLNKASDRLEAVLKDAAYPEDAVETGLAVGSPAYPKGPTVHGADSEDSAMKPMEGDLKDYEAPGGRETKKDPSGHVANKDEGWLSAADDKIEKAMSDIDQAHEGMMEGLEEEDWEEVSDEAELVAHHAEDIQEMGKELEEEDFLLKPEEMYDDVVKAMRKSGHSLEFETILHSLTKSRQEAHLYAFAMFGFKTARGCIECQRFKKEFSEPKIVVDCLRKGKISEWVTAFDRKKLKAVIADVKTWLNKGWVPAGFTDSGSPRAKNTENPDHVLYGEEAIRALQGQMGQAQQGEPDVDESGLFPEVDDSEMSVEEDFGDDIDDSYDEGDGTFGGNPPTLTDEQLDDPSSPYYSEDDEPQVDGLQTDTGTTGGLTVDYGDEVEGDPTFGVEDFVPSNAPDSLKDYVAQRLREIEEMSNTPEEKMWAEDELRSEARGQMLPGGGAYAELYPDDPWGDGGAGDSPKSFDGDIGDIVERLKSGMDADDFDSSYFDSVLGSYSDSELEDLLEQVTVFDDSEEMFWMGGAIGDYLDNRQEGTPGKGSYYDSGDASSIPKSITPEEIQSDAEIVTRSKRGPSFEDKEMLREKYLINGTADELQSFLDSISDKKVEALGLSNFINPRGPLPEPFKTIFMEDPEKMKIYYDYMKKVVGRSNKDRSQSEKDSLEILSGYVSRYEQGEW